MSKLKLRLAGLAFIGLSLLALGTRTASANDCIDVVLYCTNPQTGECMRVNPCAIPPGCIVSSQECGSTS
jgi:hypothetical protein